MHIPPPDARAIRASLPAALVPLLDGLPLHRVARALWLVDGRLPGLATVVEAVHRRHNVSAILRSCDAFGVHEAHLVTNAFKPNKGAARGAERWLELTLHADTAGCVEGLRSRGFRLYVADLDGGAVAPEEVPVDRPVALLFGSELRGVSAVARDLADGVVTVPMRGVGESLNVSVAAAITLRAVSERRRAWCVERGEPLGVPDPGRERFLRAFLERERARRWADAGDVGVGGPDDDAEGEGWG